MIFKSFLLGNLVSLCLKIINSVVVVGLYYGFLTTFSIGPSYLFLLRAQVMEEGTEKKVSATTGFITGQLMMFISIYYAPLHLALGRPHTITVLALPYLLFHFFWNNHKNFFDYGSTTRNSMRNLSIQCVFLNHLIFQLFNHFILPSSMLARLVNIYMFRCNNKMLFVTSSFVGWLIGHILFMKCLGLVLVWIRQNRSIRSNVLIRSNKYLVSELRHSMARIFSILLFITCVYHLGRIPSPILTKKLKETSKTEERDVEIETTYETKRTKQEQEGSTEEDPSPSLFSEEKEDPNKIDETKESRVNRKEKKKDEFLKKTYYKNRQIYEAFFLNLDRKKERNKIHVLFLTDTDRRKLEQKRERFEKRTLSKKRRYFLTLISQLARERESNFNFQVSFLFLEQERMDSEKETKFLQFLFDAIRTDTKNKKRKKKIIGIKEISKNVPRWSFKLINELEQQEGEGEEEVPIDYQIRSRKAKRVVIFTDNRRNNDNKDITNPDKTDEVALIRYSQQSDFRRDIIKGSMRAQRRKTVIGELFQANAHSLLFLNRIYKPHLLFFDTSGVMKLIFRNWMGEGTELKISDYIEEKKEKDKKEENKRKEKARIEIAEAWDTIPFAQAVRGLMLITQSTLRKYILLPSLIVAKNIIRILLLQFPEWSEDFKEWNREIHIKCTYNGVQLSKREFPKNWLLDGIQIKILFPFCLKPWYGSKLGSSYIDRMKKKGQKDDFSFLTVWGMETELPFGSPRKRPSFFGPILKKLEKKIGNLKKKYFLILQVLKARTGFFLTISKKTNKWFSKSILFLKIIIKEISKIKRILFSRLKEVDKSSETKKEKDSITRNQIIHESVNQIRSISWTNYLLTEKKTNDLTDRTSTIRKKIEKITKEKKKVIPGINLSPNTNKSSSNVKRFEFPKTIWQILKRRSARLIHKFYFFIKFFIEKIYIDILLSMINIPRIHTKLFLESTKTLIDKPILNIQKNHEKGNKTNETKIDLISTIQKSFYNISNNNSQNVDGLSSFSQAYVFYKLSQIQVLKLNKLRSILEYHGTPLFLKTSIKTYFGRQGIIDSEFKAKKLRNSKKNKWKNWLIGHYQYHLSQIRWSKLKLIAQKWQNSTNQCHTIQDTNLKKEDSYEKEQLSYYKKQSDYKVYLLPNQKDNFKKYYIYNLLSYRSINYEKKEVPSIYRSPFQVNKTQKNSYNYNTQKRKTFDKLAYIPINNFIGKGDIIYMEKNTDRKYFDWKIIHFCLRKKIDIEAWVKVDTNKNQNTKTEDTNYNYQLIDKIEKKNLFYLMVHQDEESNSSKKKKKWDWMGMNAEILSHPIPNLELWFFPEFLLLYNAYKMKPWFIPNNFLFFYFNRNENLSETQNINRKQKEIISSNEKKSFEFELKNQKEKESENQRDLRSKVQNQENLVSLLLNQENEIEEIYSESGMKKLQKKKLYKSNTEAELDFFLKRYLLFQLRWDGALNQRMINNIKVYCLLLRMKNPNKITLSSIQRREMNLDIMLINKNLTFTELRKRGILIIEPLRLSVKKSGPFIMHQTINISLIHKSRHCTNQRYREQRYADKEDFDKFIQRHLTGNNYSDFPFPENILSSRRRKELRILIYFHSKNRQSLDQNILFWNENNFQSCGQCLNENKDIDRHQLIKLKFFLWPNYRLEDLARMNQYWFDTNNGSRFSLLRVHMYPQLKRG
uniref:Protein TIC 214 n=1 Tax=Tapeinosperma netor TaxID=2650786 RepID=A0A5J6M4V1_9ERIC|nr:hypothetical chloroplast RF19 [Tapeinosperma netor]QEW87104.1 hypothetical chloroplast RF19 [Tapeinosperma netor]